MTTLFLILATLIFLLACFLYVLACGPDDDEEPEGLPKVMLIHGEKPTKWLWREL